MFTLRLLSVSICCLSAVIVPLLVATPASAQWAEDTSAWSFEKDDSLTYANSGTYIIATYSFDRGRIQVDALGDKGNNTSTDGASASIHGTMTFKFNHTGTFPSSATATANYTISGSKTTTGSSGGIATSGCSQGTESTSPNYVTGLNNSIYLTASTTPSLGNPQWVDCGSQKAEISCSLYGSNAGSVDFTAKTLTTVTIN